MNGRMLDRGQVQASYIFYVANIWIVMILYDFCLLHAQFCDKFINVRSSESHVQVPDWCANWKAASGAENLILQVQQSQKMGVCRNFPGGTGISHYGPNKRFVEGELNVSVQSLAFEQGADFKKCSLGLSFDRFYV
jgi:hypothetical protein